MGPALTEAVNFAGMATKGHWPVSGGTFDQAAWFVDLVQTLESETNIIDNERAKRHE